MTTDKRDIEMTKPQISQREFIETLKQLAIATRAMRESAEEIDSLLEVVHRIPVAA